MPAGDDPARICVRTYSKLYSKKGQREVAFLPSMRTKRRLSRWCIQNATQGNPHRSSIKEDSLEGGPKGGTFFMGFNSFSLRRELYLSCWVTFYYVLQLHMRRHREWRVTRSFLKNLQSGGRIFPYLARKPDVNFHSHGSLKRSARFTQSG